MVEEHDAIGHPVQCAGLVSSRVLDLARSRSMLLHPVHGASVVSPGGRRMSFRSAEPRAFVIDRAGLDRHLAEQAAQAGVEIRTGIRFDGLHPNGADRIARLSIGTGGTEEVRTRLLIGADGVASQVARACGLRRPIEILPAFEAEFPSSPGDPDQVEVYLGNSIAPGLFGWWIPDGNGGARVGLAASATGTSARAYFDRLLRKFEASWGASLRNPTAYLVSGIPVGRVPKIVADRAMLVGDAAAQVKPLSGGGIYLSQRSGKIAAEVADAALREDSLTADRLAEYSDRCDAEFGEETEKALYLRRLFLRLRDEDLDLIVGALDDAGLRESIVAFGDIDFPSRLAWKLLRQSPALLRLLPQALSAALFRSGSRAPELDPVRRHQR